MIGDQVTKIKGNQDGNQHQLDCRSHLKRNVSSKVLCLEEPDSVPVELRGLLVDACKNARACCRITHGGPQFDEEMPGGNWFTPPLVKDGPRQLYRGLQVKDPHHLWVPIAGRLVSSTLTIKGRQNTIR